jgi:hypothetical protein
MELGLVGVGSVRTCVLQRNALLDATWFKCVSDAAHVIIDDVQPPGVPVKSLTPADLAFVTTLLNSAQSADVWCPASFTTAEKSIIWSNR